MGWKETLGAEIVGQGVGLAMRVGASWFKQTARDFTSEILSNRKDGVYDSLRTVLSPSHRQTNKTLRAVARKDDDFINWNRNFRYDAYRAEQDNRLLGLPYSYMSLWHDAGSVTLKPIKTKFRREAGDSDWEEVVRHGYDRLTSTRAAFDQQDGAGRPRYAIRLGSFDPDKKEMKVQRALYTDQVRSNMLADYRYIGNLMDIGQRSTLREMLSRAHPGHLPPLTDKRLANTVGVSVIMLFHDDDGKLRPLIQLRDPSDSAMGNSGLHCTGSRAALWPRNDQEVTPQNFFEDEALTSIGQDFGLTPETIEGDLHLMGLVREHARLGKPQLFYYGLTNLHADEIVKYRLDKQYQNDAKGLQKLGKRGTDSKYARMTEGQFKDLFLRNVWFSSNRERYPFTHEAEAMLAVLSHEFGDYDEL